MKPSSTSRLIIAALLGLHAVAQSPALLQSPVSAATPAPFTLSIPAFVPMGSGPYKAIMEADPGLPTHTVYRPNRLAALNTQLLPIVLWGNGGCVNNGNIFRWFLSEISSYGFLVIAIGPIGPRRIEMGPVPDPASLVKPAHLSRSSQLIDALNWATAENNRPASQFFHRLDSSKVAVMGQSCGGVQALEVSPDPRITTTVLWNSGLPPAPTGMGGGEIIDKNYLDQLHAPIAYFSGDPTDLAFNNSNSDFERIASIPVFRAWERGISHAGTYRDPNGGEFSGIAVAWLNWQLKDDANAALMFTGPHCGLCINPRWVVRKKNLD